MPREFSEPMPSPALMLRRLSLSTDTLNAVPPLRYFFLKNDYQIICILTTTPSENGGHAVFR